MIAMVQLVCQCLNIRIHGKGANIKLRDAFSAEISERALADNFFSSQVYDVLLDLGGVTKAQKSLCTSRLVDKWVITTCLCCENEIYAKHLDDNDRVLVSCNVEKDPARITSLMESENYSALFKLVLPETNDNFIQNNIGTDLRDSFERSFKHIQQQVTCYLKDEQKAMEERIRLYTEQQNSRYLALRQKVRKHKQSMLYQLLERKSTNKMLRENPSPVPNSILSSEDSSSSTDSANVPDKTHDFLMEAMEHIPEQPVPKRSFRRMHSVNNPPQRSKVARPFRNTVTHSIDIGDVFDMEGFETADQDTSFFNSDDDSDGSCTEDNPKREQQPSKHHIGSLPISVPAWSNYSRYSVHDVEDPVISHTDPEQLAASFRALVEGSSVNDGTELFGDLPRRRLNTGDLIKSRPI